MNNFYRALILIIVSILVTFLDVVIVSHLAFKIETFNIIIKTFCVLINSLFLIYLFIEAIEGSKGNDVFSGIFKLKTSIKYDVLNNEYDVYTRYGFFWRYLASLDTFDSAMAKCQNLHKKDNLYRESKKQKYIQVNPESYA